MIWTGKHLAFVVNTDWFFLSHRLPLARAALAQGMRVTVLCPDHGHVARLREEGLSHVALPLDRRGINPLRDGTTLHFLRSWYADQRPDLVHHVTPKPVIYGSLAARSVGLPAVVNAVSGLGTAFTNQASVLSRVVTRLYRHALRPRQWRTIFQNPDDRELFIGLGLVHRNATVLIRGSGVDPERFRPISGPSQPPLVMFASRLLRDKGIEDFVEVARSVRASRPEVRFVVVGAPDPGNPSSVSEGDVRRWVDEGAIQWLGRCERMHEVLARATVVVLPTRYREGLPRVLVEAAACGVPIVTTDVPGCREVVHHEQTGLLAPAGDVEAMARAVEWLLDRPERAREFGNRGRTLAATSLSLGAVTAAHMGLYGDLLNRTGTVVT